MIDPLVLLARHQPVLRYDQRERFFADSAEQLMALPGVELRRESGEVIGRTGEGLSLGFLGPMTYGDGQPVATGDGLSITGREYWGRYEQLRREHPEFNDRFYGRIVKAGDAVWLQYWMWYLYNDYRLGLGIGLHEGDWESVHLRLDPEGGEPDLAVYAQHKTGEARPWADVPRDPGDQSRPVVFVALGSHAAYFTAGTHRFSGLTDICQPGPIVRPALDVIGDPTPDWMLWPGRWGDTKPRDQRFNIEQWSPKGPVTQRPWTDPMSIVRAADRRA
jgi:hypothetical protein